MRRHMEFYEKLRRMCGDCRFGSVGKLKEVYVFIRIQKTLMKNGLKPQKCHLHVSKVKTCLKFTQCSKMRFLTSKFSFSISMISRSITPK